MAEQETLLIDSNEYFSLSFEDVIAEGNKPCIYFLKLH